MACAADVLFKEIKWIPIKDCYAKPVLSFRVLTNITELIRNPQKDALISLFGGDEKCDILSMSDFEYFQTLTELLPQLVGTLEGELFKEEILLFQEKNIDFSTVNFTDLAREVWENSKKKLADFGGDYQIFLSDIGVENLYHEREQFCSLGGVEKYNNHSDTSAVLCDLRGMDFVRPDPYHATLAEEKYRRGETLSADEKAMLISQTIYLLCRADCELEIHLLADGDGRAAADFLAYLKRQNACGRVWIAADGEMANETILALCALSDGRLTIRPEIVLGKTDSAYNFEKRLSSLAAVYPISLWRFGGVLTQAPLFVAGHRHARRVICHLLAAMVDDRAKAVAMAKAIFAWE